MDFIQKNREENSAYVQLLILAGYALAGLLICSLLSIILIIAIYGKEIFTHPESLTVFSPENLDKFKILQIGSSIGLFVLPPLFLAITERIKISQFYDWKKPVLPMLGIIFILMLVSFPLTELTALINQKMTLPGFLKPLEQWMRDKETEASKMVIAFLTVRNAWDFVINMLMIAVLPAIGEELMFRGGIQRSFSKMFRNPHVAIWLTAFIFSAIHFQFFGFLPRFLLGALFGYIYFWTKSLWYPMFAHFLNNGYAVCMSLYFQKHNIPLDRQDETSSFNWYGYAIGLILTVLLLNYLKKQYSNNGKQLDESIHH
jgi:membrane protease YdiL (CAAX protease family)